jgi:hypothetical protein
MNLGCINVQCSPTPIIWEGQALPSDQIITNEDDIPLSPDGADGVLVTDP